MTDLSHLTALQTRLRHERERERERFAIAYAASGNCTETELRTVWIRQIEKEIEAEYAFLGIDPTVPAEIAEMSDADLIAELSA